MWRDSGEVDGVPGSGTNVYTYPANQMITVAQVFGTLAVLLNLAIVLQRAGALRSMSDHCLGVSCSADIRDVLADEDGDAEQGKATRASESAEEVSQMSHALSLIVGPFAVVFVQMTCLLGVMRIMLQDNEGNPLEDANGNINPDKACASPVGYFGTISCVSANIFAEGYVSPGTVCHTLHHAVV